METKVHCCTHNRPPPVPILGQPNPVHIPTSHLLEIHPNIMHPSTPRSPQCSLSFRLLRCQISWKICPVGAGFSLADRRTDITKPIVAFRTFANAPNSMLRYAHSQYCVCPTASACPSPSAIRLTSFVVHICYQSNFPADFMYAALTSVNELLFGYDILCNV